MRKLAVLLIIVTLFLGCVTSWQPKCRHNAVLQTLVVGEHHPVRIVAGPTKTPGIWHAQGQVLIEREWEWLGNDKLGVFVTDQDRGFEAIQYWTVGDFVKTIWRKTLWSNGSKFEWIEIKLKEGTK